MQGRVAQNVDCHMGVEGFSRGSEVSWLVWCVVVGLVTCTMASWELGEGGGGNEGLSDGRRVEECFEV